MGGHRFSGKIMLKQKIEESFALACLAKMPGCGAR
jgi:hypothetical protein